MQNSSTGSRGGETTNPFAGRPRVGRSPVARRSTKSTRETKPVRPTSLDKQEDQTERATTIEIPSTDEESPVIQRTKKRKTGNDSPKADSPADEGLTPAMKSLQTMAEDLAKFARENRNVHKDIKGWAANIVGCVRRVNKDYRRERERAKDSGKESRREEMEDAQVAELKREMENIKKENEKKKKETMERERKYEEKIRRLERKVEDLERGRLPSGSRPSQTRELVNEEDIDGAASYQDWEKLRDKEWPDKVFKAAFLEQGSPLEARNSDVVMLVEPPDAKSANEGIRRAFEKRYPDLANSDGSFVHMAVATKMIDGNGVVEEKMTYILKVEIENEGADWYEALAKIRGTLAGNGRTKVAVYPPSQDKYGKETRRMMECLFRRSGITCAIYVREKTPPKEVKGKTNERTTGAIIVKDEGRTYAELLRTVKGNINPASREASCIRTIRKSRDGQLIIVVDKKDTEAVKALQGRVGNSVGTSNVKISQPREGSIIYIKEIDGITTKEEVTKALTEVIAEEDILGIGELRPYYGGNQAITITIRREAADILMDKGVIRIGLNLCPVSGRVTVPRCYRCWGYEHLGRDCKEVQDLSRACRKCGGIGHMAKDCQKSQYCLNYKAEGHSAGSGGCPMFRKALSKIRAKAKTRRKASKQFRRQLPRQELEDDEPEQEK